MAHYEVEFSYKVPEWGHMDIDLEDNLTEEERDAAIFMEIHNINPDMEEVEVTSVKEID